MTRETLIIKAVKTLSKLPNDKVKEVSDFTEYLFKNYDEEIMQKGIEKLVSNSNTFDFLKDEEDLYSEADLKEIF